MTTDSTQPQTDLGPAPANGQGQSQGHRRRRRRRKNKNSQAGAQPAQQAQLPQQAQPPAAAAAPPLAKPAHPSHQNQGQTRKKKKFFQKGSASAAQPGNSVSSHGHTHSPGNSQAVPRASARASRRDRVSLWTDGPQLPGSQRECR